ncbi:hypothetical protein BC826DRAFT_677805 [Russula brevipes]|nr:hypothetical protein BC826DRAFT_677805 [Russula brevipes]
MRPRRRISCANSVPRESRRSPTRYASVSARRAGGALGQRRRSRLGFLRTCWRAWAPTVRKANLLARRSASEVGYTRQVKLRLGYGIRPEEDRVTRRLEKDWIGWLGEEQPEPSGGGSTVAVANGARRFRSEASLRRSTGLTANRLGRVGRVGTDLDRTRKVVIFHGYTFNDLGYTRCLTLIYIDAKHR